MTVVDKIASLQRLAADGAATPPEAANAAAAAAELMRKHRLNQADVDAGPIGWYWNSPLYTMGLHVQWRRHLAVGLANINGCRVVLSNGVDENLKSVAKATLVGQRNKVELVRHLYIFIMREIERMVRRLPTAGGAVAVRMERESFRLGAVMSVLTRLRTEGSAPAATIADVDRWCEENVPQTHHRSKPRQLNHVVSEALMRGVTAGREITVRKAVAG